MVLILTIIFFTGGGLAVLYSVLALLSMVKYAQAQKARPEKFVPETGKPATVGPPAAEAYCKRAWLLLQHQRFDAALADCKRAIDINPNHAEAHTLWEHALDKKIPAVPVAAPAAAAAAPPPPAAAEPEIKRVKKVVKRVKRRKAITTPPVVEEKIKAPVSEDETPILAEAEPEEEIILIEAEAAVPPPEETAEEAAAPVTIPGEEAPPAEEPAIAVEPEAIELEVEAEIEPVGEAGIVEIEEEAAVLVEPFPEEKAPGVEQPVIELGAEAGVEPAAEPEAAEEIEEKGIEREPFPEEEEGPLIPEDKLAVPRPPRESLLEEFDHEKLREFEEGEAGAGDTEWTRYADKKGGPELAESKIDMNELPAQAVGLKETLSDLRQAETYNLQGETYISKNLYNNAIKEFSRALEINPSYVDALINRGSAYAQLGRFNDALMDFNRALKFEKKDAELYNKRGEIYMQNNMYDQAIKDFTASIVLNPMYSDAYLNRGRAYSEKGMPDEAMDDFNHAIKADSDHSFSFIDRAAPSIHADADSSGSMKEAENFNQMGLADLENEKFQEACEHFTKALGLAASYTDGYINRGRAYIGLNQADEAIADFNQAVLFDPLNASLYYWRAQAWKVKKDTFNMREDLKLSCEMGHEPACLEYRKIKSAKK